MEINITNKYIIGLIHFTFYPFYNRAYKMSYTIRLRHLVLLFGNMFSVKYFSNKLIIVFWMLSVILFFVHLKFNWNDYRVWIHFLFRKVMLSFISLILTLLYNRLFKYCNDIEVEQIFNCYISFNKRFLLNRWVSLTFIKTVL